MTSETVHNVTGLRVRMVQVSDSVYEEFLTCHCYSCHCCNSCLARLKGAWIRVVVVQEGQQVFHQNELGKAQN